MTAAPIAEPHRMALRVYYEDTDAAGMVYHSNYLKFAERGRTEMLRFLGFDHSRLRQQAGIVFTVRRCNIEYRAAARLDDPLTVETHVDAIAGATLSLRQLVCRDDEVLAALNVLVACVGENGRPRRVPAPLREALAGCAAVTPAL